MQQSLNNEESNGNKEKEVNYGFNGIIKRQKVFSAFVISNTNFIFYDYFSLFNCKKQTYRYTNILLNINNFWGYIRIHRWEGNN
ncbi:MAG TPA: hypothetical protein VJB89_03740 [Candidatus Nanoarchaeia archaeon]|nr:hypothetical protein [Candidatus Nanoarchaeia archaeon]